MKGTLEVKAGFGCLGHDLEMFFFGYSKIFLPDAFPVPLGVQVFMINKWIKICLGVVILWGSGCGSLKNFPFDTGVGKEVDYSSNELQLQYHSVGCFYIQYGNEAILTDPFWTHVPMRKVMFGELASDPAQIDPYLPELDKVKAVLVGHGHYDHMLDLPYLDGKLPAETRILGSETLKCTMAPYALSNPCEVVTENCAMPDKAGKWISLSNGNVRVLPIQSAHPPQVLGIHLYPDSIKEPLESHPVKVNDFQEGETFAWLIDFMDVEDKRQVAKRIFVQTSSTGWPAGYFPEEILNQHPVEVAILAMDCARIKMNDEKSIVDYLKPKQVIFCHWENFFRPKTKVPKPVTKVNLKRIKSKLNTPTGYYIFPEWSSVFRF